MDVPWKYLNFFLDDDEKLEHIGREYQAGRMLTGEIKAELVQVSLDGWHWDMNSYGQGLDWEWGYAGGSVGVAQGCRWGILYCYS